MPKYNFKDSMKEQIAHYDKLIADTIEQIKTLQKQCKNYQRIRKEYYVHLKEFEGKENA